MILHKINNSAQSNFKVVGFLDGNPELEGKRIYGYPIFGGHWKLSEVLQTVSVNYIFICEYDIQTENFNRLKRIAEFKGIKIKRLHISLQNILTDTSDKNNISSKIGEVRI